MLKANEICKIKRDALGLTQAELAYHVGCTAGTISSYESGKEVTDMVRKGISWAIKDLENKMEQEQLNDYKLRVATENVIAEKNPKLKMMKLHSLMFSNLKYVQYLENLEKGEL